MMTIRAYNTFLVAFFFGAIAFSTNSANEASTVQSDNPNTTAEGKSTGTMFSINIDDNCQRIGSIIEDFKKAKSDDERRALHNKLADTRLKIYTSICGKLRVAYHDEKEGNYINAVCNFVEDLVYDAEYKNLREFDGQEAVQSDKIQGVYALARWLYSELPDMNEKMDTLVDSNKVDTYKQEFGKAIDELEDINKGLRKLALLNIINVENENEVEDQFLKIDRIFMAIAELLLNTN